MRQPKINIIIVDDHPVVIQGLKMMLDGYSHFIVRGTFTDGSGILSFLKTNETDIILLDVTLPDISGIELCRQIKNLAPHSSIIMLTNRSERSIILHCLQNGASGYVLKNASVEEISTAIHGVIAGNIMFSNEVKEIISRPAKSELSEMPTLTKREKEIIKLVTKGKTSAQIAGELCLSTLTVDTHRKNIMQKLGAKNVVEMLNIVTQYQLL